MRLQWFTFAFPLSALAALLIAGCPDDETLIHPNPPGPDAGDSGNQPIADGSTDGQTDAPPSVPTLLRIAQLVPGTPAVDFCIAADTTTQDAGADAGDAGGPNFVLPAIISSPFYNIPTGLEFGKVTAYQDISAVARALPQGPALIRIVRGAAAGSRIDCSTAAPLADIHTTLPPITAGAVLTIAAVGDPTPGSANPPQAALFVDRSAGTTDKADVRFINAVPSPNNLDFGFVSGVTFSPVSQNAAFKTTGTTSDAGASDGYVAIDPVADAAATTAQIRASTLPTTAKNIPNFALTAGSLTTVFAISTSGAVPFTGLVCHDAPTPAADAGAASLFSDCTLP